MSRNWQDVLNMPLNLSNEELGQVIDITSNLLAENNNGQEENVAGENVTNPPATVNNATQTVQTQGQQNGDVPPNTEGNNEGEKKNWVLQTNNKTGGTTRTITEERTEYDDDAVKKYTDSGLNVWDNDYLPIKRKQEEYLEELQKLYKTYDPTQVPEKEKDRRLAGLLMLSDAITHLGGVTGEMAGEQHFGGHSGLGLIPERENKGFEAMYKRYLAKNDAVTQQKELEREKALKRAIDNLQDNHKIDIDYDMARLKEKERLTKEARERYKKTTKTTTVDGNVKTEYDKDSMDYKKDKKTLTAKSGNTYINTGSKGEKEKEEKMYSLAPPFRGNVKRGGTIYGTTGDRALINFRKELLAGEDDIEFNEGEIKRLYAKLSSSNGSALKLYFGESFKPANDVQGMHNQLYRLSEYVAGNRLRDGMDYEQYQNICQQYANALLEEHGMNQVRYNR